jgi:hypothetical protein
MSMSKAIESYQGLLIIGDPHVESRIPDFRKDNYPRVMLDKISWCLSYAREHNLLSIFLGDIFHLPRDNANWLLGELMVLFHRGVIGIYGNHDVRQNELTEDDSLDVLVKAGKYQILNEKNPWRGEINGQSVVIGGTSWGKMLPRHFNPDGKDNSLVFWMAHHDVKVLGYEDQGHFDPSEILGINVVINGHIHRRLENTQIGSTLWITPGNIARRARNDATKYHVPSVLKIDIDTTGWGHHYVEVPHQPFDEVFHESVLSDLAIAADESTFDSAFVAGLAELLIRKTETAAGLMAFLEMNLKQFEDVVAEEIMKLAKEVTPPC